MAALLTVCSSLSMVIPLGHQAQIPSRASPDSVTAIIDFRCGGCHFRRQHGLRSTPPGTTPPFEPVHLQPRHVPANDVPELRKDDDFWYVAVGPDKPKPPPPPPKNGSAWQKFFRAIAAFFDTPGAAFLLWSLLAGLLVAAIVAFIQSGSGESLFRRSRRLRLKEGEGSDSALPEDPTLALQRAIDAGQYAEAERCLFLLALTRLGERGVIHRFGDKTNREYLREMRGGPLYDDFAPLLRHYEYTFYGGFTF